MKSPRLPLILVTFPLLVSIGACTEATIPSPAKPADVALAPETPTSVVELEAIKVIPFERKFEFIGSMTQLTTLVDGRIAALATKETARKADWPADLNLAIQSMRDARITLGSAIRELPSISAEFWIASREKATRALLAATDAIDKATRMTTDLEKTPGSQR